MTTLPTGPLRRRARLSLRRLLKSFVVGLILHFGPIAVAAAQEAPPASAATLPRAPVVGNLRLLPRQSQSSSQAPPVRQARPAPPAKSQAPATPGDGGAPSPVVPPARPTKVAPPSPATPPAPPPYRVVTVVHRMSGWRLLSLLAASAPSALELDDVPSASYVHTNVVAGFLSDDNRTVVARLPQAEVEVAAANWSALLPGSAHPAGAAGRSEFALVLSDGRRVGARFVGLDAATGLSLLEASEPVPLAAVVGDTGHTEDPTVGQRVVFYAPVRVGGEAARRKATEPKSAAPAAATVGNGGVVYASIMSAEGQLTEVVRAPSGHAYAFTAQAGSVSPAWTGAVATDGSGSLVGIVSRSEAGLTEIVPVDTLRRAAERVKATRSSVPQPWLGARGDAAANAPLEFWVSKGWERAHAFSLIQSRGGVLLTSVAPGTPAALAGLRPGDLISRVGGREVRSVQDLSLVLKEQPIGSAVEFTVVRPPQPEPIRLPVLLSGTQNPAVATAEAETRAARESLLAVGAELRLAREEQFRAAGSAFERPAALARLKEAETKFETALREATEAGRRIFEARARTLSGPEMPPPTAGDEQAQRPLLFVGLRAVALSPRGAARLGAKGGFLVVTIEEDSPAAACGLRPGDVIETVGGRQLTRDGFQQLLSDAWASPVKLGVVRTGRRAVVEFAFSHDCAK
jgi:S1-C subfamily serine protease